MPCCLLREDFCNIDNVSLSHQKASKYVKIESGQNCALQDEVA